MEHRQRKRLRIEPLECRRLLHGHAYGHDDAPLKKDWADQEPPGHVKHALEEKHSDEDVSRNNSGHHRGVGGVVPTRDGDRQRDDSLRKSSSDTAKHGDVIGSVTVVIRIDAAAQNGNGPAVALSPPRAPPSIVLGVTTRSGPNIPGLTSSASGLGLGNTTLGGKSASANQQRLGQTQAAAGAELLPRGNGSEDADLAAEVAGAQEALNKTDGPEAGEAAGRSDGQLRNVPAAFGAQSRAPQHSAQAAPLTSAAATVARHVSLPQSDRDAPLTLDARDREFAARSSPAEETTPAMNLASAVWLALGQLPTAVALEPVEAEGQALLQDLFHANWAAVEDAIDEMLVQLQTGIAWVTPQNVRDAVFASSAAVLAAFAGEAARRRQQRLKDEELLALAFDADGHLALA